MDDEIYLVCHESDFQFFYEQTLAALLEKPEIYYTVREIGLDLAEQEGSWKIVYTPALRDALAGAISDASAS